MVGQVETDPKHQPARDIPGRCKSISEREVAAHSALHCRQQRGRECAGARPVSDAVWEAQDNQPREAQQGRTSTGDRRPAPNSLHPTDCAHTACEHQLMLADCNYSRRLQSTAASVRLGLSVNQSSAGSIQCRLPSTAGASLAEPPGRSLEKVDSS